MMLVMILIRFISSEIHMARIVSPLLRWMPLLMNIGRPKTQEVIRIER